MGVTRVPDGLVAVLALSAAACGELHRQDFSPPVEDGSIEVEGATLHTTSVGAGEPIVVVHGGPGMDHSYLRPGMDGLAEGYRLIFYDQRGLGRSEGAVDSASINLERYLEDLDAVRAASGVERPFMLAHSWGGLLAMLYTLDHPDRVGGLILLSTGEPGLRYAELTRERQLARRTPADAATLDSLRGSEAVARRDRAAINRAYRIAFRGTFADPALSDLLVIDFGERTTRHGATVATLVMGPLGAYDYWERLGEISVPTLILHGDEDPVPAAMVRELQERIAGSRLVVLPEVGHFPYIEAPGPTFAAIDDFLRGLELAAP